MNELQEMLFARAAWYGREVWLANGRALESVEDYELFWDYVYWAYIQQCVDMSHN